MLHDSSYGDLAETDHDARFCAACISDGTNQHRPAGLQKDAEHSEVAPTILHVGAIQDHQARVRPPSYLI
jgi:hypothetical protein